MYRLKTGVRPRNQDPPKGLGQVLLVINPHDVDRNARCVGTDAYSIELSGFSIGIVHGLGAISDVWVGNNLSFFIFSIQEPQLARWHPCQQGVVQLLHLAAFWFRLRSNVLLDLLPHRHIGLFGSAVNPVFGEARDKNWLGSQCQSMKMIPIERIARRSLGQSAL
jgi:hypothetical protein